MTAKEIPVTSQQAADTTTPNLAEALRASLADYRRPRQSADTTTSDTTPIVHLVGEEDDEPACWTTDDAPWGSEVVITHNPLNVTCPACADLLDGEADA